MEAKPWGPAEYIALTAIILTAAYYLSRGWSLISSRLFAPCADCGAPDAPIARHIAPIIAPPLPMARQIAPAEPEPEVLPLWFWWQRAISHPTHIMLVGETQSGKSTTARALLAERARTDQIVIIDPHERFNNWGDAPVIGTGYRKSACAAAIGALRNEMARRYAPGQEIGAPITCFIDEFPTIVAEHPEVRPAFTQLLREAAKAKIRLVILTQDANVETLGIKGEGPVRENMAKILLGAFAVKSCPLAASEERPAAWERLGNVEAVSVRGLDVTAARIGEVQIFAPIYDAVPVPASDTASEADTTADTDTDTDTDTTDGDTIAAIRVALSAGMSGNDIARLMRINRNRALKIIAAARQTIDDVKM